MQKMIHNTEGMSLFAQWALALQHLLAVFSGTLIVPMITGLPVSVTLFFAGVSTLLFQFFTRAKIPFFYSCSFCFLAGMAYIKNTCEAHGMSTAMSMCYVSFGIFVSGLVYIILGQVMRFVKYERIMKLFPPIVYGTFIMSLGTTLLGASFSSIGTDWLVAVVAVAVTMVSQLFFRGIMKLIPINIGIFVATVVSLFRGGIDLSHVHEVPWIAMPFDRDYMALTVFEDYDGGLLMLSVFTILPLVLMSIVEHIADFFAISRTTKIDYVRTVGLHRTLSANGLATMLSAMFGAPATTAFSQTTGLVALIRVSATRVISLAALVMIFLAFSPKVAAFLAAIPPAAIGGATILMYGTVIVVGLRTLVDAKVDLSNIRNLLIFGPVLVLTVGINFGQNDSITVFGLTLSSLTVAALTGIILNIILPEEKNSNLINDEKVS